MIKQIFEISGSLRTISFNKNGIIIRESFESWESLDEFKKFKNAFHTIVNDYLISKPWFIQYNLTGSQLIFEAHNKGYSDFDYCVHVTDIEAACEDFHWMVANVPEYESNFKSIRIDYVNLILTDDFSWYMAHKVATDMMIREKLIVKKERIQLFEQCFKDMGIEEIKN